MKNIVLILFLSSLSLNLIGQPVVNRAGIANTVSDARWQAQYNLFIPRVNDTLSVNIGIDSCGAIIYNRATNSVFYRACNPKRWLPLEGGGGQIDVFLIAGQSNAVGNSGQPSLAPIPESGTAFQFRNNAIVPAVEPIGNSNGSAWGAFAQTYWKSTSRKICFVPAAVNGTSMASAANVGFGTWDTTGTLYATSVLKVDSAMNALTAAGYTPIFKGVLWCQGETDADGINRGIINQSIYSAAFAKLIKNYRLEFGSGISFNISRIGFRTDTIQTGYLAVQAAQVAISNPDSLTNMTYWNAPFFPQRNLMVDIYHYRQAGYNEMGRTIAEEYVASTSNNFQYQANNLYYKRGNVGIGDIIPTSPLHIYKTGTGAEIKLYDSLATAVRLDIENRVNDPFSSSAVWFRTTQGLRSQIGSAPPASISGGSSELSFFNSVPSIAINSDSGDVNISTSAVTNNLFLKSKLRVKNNGQVAIATGVDPAASAMLDIVSTSRGVLVPRMTTAQQNAISSPATSLLIFNLDSNKHCYYNGSTFVCYGTGSGSQSWNSVMTVSPNLSSSYTSNLNNNSWNLQNTSDFTIHSDAGTTTRLKLNSSTSNLFAPNGASGFRVTNDTTFVKGTTEATLSSEGQPVVWNNTDYIQLFAGSEAGVSGGEGGFFEIAKNQSVTTVQSGGGSRVSTTQLVAETDSTTQVNLLAQSESRVDQIIVGFEDATTFKRGITLYSQGDSMFIKYGWGPPSTSSLTGYALQARNTNTGALVDFTGSVGASALSAITAATATNDIDNTQYRQRWRWTTLAGDTALVVNATTTAAASDAQVGIAALLKGANSNSGQFTVAISGTNTHTGTTSENVGVYGSASGGTYNYAGWFNEKLSVGGASIAAGATAWDGSEALAMFRMLDNSWGGITVYNNANYATALTIAAQGIATNQDLLFNALGGDMMFNMARVKIGNNVNATAHLHIVASTTAANTGQIKFDEGSALTTPEDGTLNYVSNNLQFTETSTVYTLAKTLTNTATLDFGSTAAQQSADLTITVTGAADGDAVYLGPVNASTNANSCFTAFVSASNTVTVRFNNYSSGAIDPTSGTFRVVVTKY